MHSLHNRIHFSFPVAISFSFSSRSRIRCPGISMYQSTQWLGLTCGIWHVPYVEYLCSLPLCNRIHFRPLCCTLTCWTLILCGVRWGSTNESPRTQRCCINPSTHYYGAWPALFQIPVISLVACTNFWISDIIVHALLTYSHRQLLAHFISFLERRLCVWLSPSTLNS